jgi:hypothetical protein
MLMLCALEAFVAAVHLAGYVPLTGYVNGLVNTNASSGETEPR